MVSTASVLECHRIRQGHSTLASWGLGVADVAAIGGRRFTICPIHSIALAIKLESLLNIEKNRFFSNV